VSVCSAPPAILSPSPQLCQNGGLSVLSSIGGGGREVAGGQAVRVGAWKTRVIVLVRKYQHFVAKFRSEVLHSFTNWP
jgi:hypothetical protein